MSAAGEPDAVRPPQGQARRKGSASTPQQWLGCGPSSLAQSLKYQAFERLPPLATLGIRENPESLIFESARFGQLLAVHSVLEEQGSCSNGFRSGRMAAKPVYWKFHSAPDPSASKCKVDLSTKLVW